MLAVENQVMLKSTTYDHMRDELTRARIFLNGLFDDVLCCKSDVREPVLMTTVYGFDALLKLCYPERYAAKMAELQERMGYKDDEQADD